MVPVYEKDLTELGLSKYYELDLDADMMRHDLKEMKIMRINEMEEELEASMKTAKESQKNWTTNDKLIKYLNLNQTSYEYTILQ